MDQDIKEIQKFVGKDVKYEEIAMEYGLNGKNIKETIKKILEKKS